MKKLTLIFTAIAATAIPALASNSLPDQCIYALNRTAAGALSLQGSVDLNLSCGIVVDSKNSTAFLASGFGSVNAKYIDVVGGYSGSGQISFSSVPQSGAPYRPDPLAFLAAPSPAKCDYTSVNIAAGSSNLTPGTYCGGIGISGNAQVTLAPGTYVLMGGGLRVSGSGKLSGQGTTIVLTQGLGYSYGPLTISDSALLNLQAPKSGDYPGILFWQDGRFFNGVKPSVINGSTSSKLEGILYFPTSALTWSGSSAGAEGNYLAIIADTVSITGPATIAANYGSTLQQYLQIGATLMGLQGGSAVPSSAPAARIEGSIGGGGTFALAGNVHPMVALSTDQGEAGGSTVLPGIVMHLAMTKAQRQSLQQLIAAQQTRSSPYFHKWLTSEQVAATYGASPGDIAKVSAWLQGMGFTDVQVARTRTFISMTGTAAQARAAFQTPIHRYLYNGSAHYANASDPQLPGALQGVVESIRGLDDFRPHPHVHPRFTSSVTGNHFITPNDFATIYNVNPLYSAGINGSGQTIAVMGQTDVVMSDIEAFQTNSGLSVKDPTVVLAGPDPGTNSSDMQEADLDLEWAGAIAPGATLLYVNSSNVLTSLTYAIDNNVAPVVSMSYGNCEAQEGGIGSINSLNAMLMVANSEGITVVAPSGDSGAADCDSGTGPATQGLAVDFPGSSPYVTSAGGTEFNEGSGTYWNSTNNASNGSATGYIPEVAWNDSTAPATNTVSRANNASITLSATGGGASSICGNYCGKPSWQTGTGVPNDGARDVPDIALAASPNHDGYLVCNDGSCVVGFRQTANGNLTVVGGTSCSTPTFAAIVALLDQATGSRQGNVNPQLYSLASVSTDAFHGISSATNGNNNNSSSNIVTCIGGTPSCSSTVSTTYGTFGYSVGTGYSQVTGLGSINAQNLVNEWNDDFAVTVNPATLTLASGSSANVTVAVTAVSGFKQTVNLSCSVPTSLTGVTCSIPTSVAGQGTVTMTLTSVGAAGTPFVPRFYFPLGGFLAATVGMFLVTRRRARVAGVGVLTFALLLSGCGSGSSSPSPTPTGSVQPTTTTANVSVTATAGSITRSATVGVTYP